MNYLEITEMIENVLSFEMDNLFL